MTRYYRELKKTANSFILRYLTKKAPFATSIAVVYTQRLLTKFLIHYPLMPLSSLRMAAVLTFTYLHTKGISSKNSRAIYKADKSSVLYFSMIVTLNCLVHYRCR